jgi:hypothetical protein
MDLRRLELQDLLEAITPKVYFQPPPNVKLEYPCIIYERDYAQTEFADNAPYRRTKRYIVTVVTKDPDSDIPDKVARLRMCLFNRFYTADNLNHDVFNLFF